MKSRSEEGNGEQSSSQNGLVKQGWAQLKALHCKSLPEKIAAHGSKSYKRIQIEMLAHRWQHHCLEVILSFEFVNKIVIYKFIIPTFFWVSNSNIISV